MMSRSSTRLLLVFRCGGEYVFVDNETKTMMTVTLSTAAINLFRREDVMPDDLARHAAEWGLLNRQPHRSVDLTASEDLSRFCRYYFSSEPVARQAC